MQRSICFGRYLITRDSLTAAMTRLGSGFTPPSVISETRQYASEILTLVNQMEQLASATKVSSSLESPRIQRDCCGRD